MSVWHHCTLAQCSLAMMNLHPTQLQANPATHHIRPHLLILVIYHPSLCITTDITLLISHLPYLLVREHFSHWFLDIINTFNNKYIIKHIYYNII